LTQTGGGGAEVTKAVKNLLEVMSENHLNIKFRTTSSRNLVCEGWRIVECSWAGETRGFEMAEGLGFTDMVSDGFEFALDVEEYIERRTRVPNECME
jgi:hypothetical protein